MGSITRNGLIVKYLTEKFSEKKRENSLEFSLLL